MGNGGLRFEVDGEEVDIVPEVVIVAGFTGRNAGELRDHIAELEKEGVAAPPEVPSFYVLSPSTLIQDDSLPVAHPGTSGEAEIALLIDGERAFVTLASDHTDRKAEVLDIGLAKRACPKPLARSAWRLADVAAHWDMLELRSWIEEDGEKRAYQQGVAGSMLHPDELLARMRFVRKPRSYALLTGTVPVIGGIRASGRFWAELANPRSRRTIDLEYQVRVLDVLEEARR